MLLDLAHAIESIDPGSTIGAVAYGQGGTDAFVVSVADGANDPNRLTVAEQLEAKKYVPYAKHLEYRERYDYQGCQTHEWTTISPNQRTRSTPAGIQVPVVWLRVVSGRKADVQTLWRRTGDVRRGATRRAGRDQDLRRPRVSPRRYRGTTATQAIVDLPQEDGSGESARVYGLLTETDLDELSVGTEVVARFCELFDDGERPINSFKFSAPREVKR